MSDPTQPPPALTSDWKEATEAAEAWWITDEEGRNHAIYCYRAGYLSAKPSSASWSTTPPTGRGYYWSRAHGGHPVIAFYTGTGMMMSCDQTVIVLDSDEGRDWMATQDVEFWPEPLVFAGKPKEPAAPDTDVATTCPQCGSLEVRIMRFTECGLSIRMCYCQKCPHQWVEKGKA